jgi:hypothetical protein
MAAKSHNNVAAALMRPPMGTVTPVVHTPHVYHCPSADIILIDTMRMSKPCDSEGQERLFKANYAACWGGGTFQDAWETRGMAGAFNIALLPRDGGHVGVGKFGSNLGTNVGKITDGASRTLAVSEVLGYDSRKDCRGSWLLYGMGMAAFSAKTPPNARGSATHPEYYDQIDGCETAIPQSHPLHCVQELNTGNVWAAARSRHHGGVNAAMCDGSTHFYSDRIDPGLWRDLATIDGAARNRGR